MKKPCFVFSSSPEYEKWFTWFRRAYLHNTMLWKQRELVIWMTNPKKKSETYKHKFPWWKSSILFKYGIPPPSPVISALLFSPLFILKLVLKGALPSHLSFQKYLEPSLRGMPSSCSLFELGWAKYNEMKFQTLGRKITSGFCRSWVDFNQKVIFFSDCCVWA